MLAGIAFPVAFAFAFARTQYHWYLYSLLGLLQAHVHMARQLGSQRFLHAEPRAILWSFGNWSGCLH